MTRSVPSARVANPAFQRRDNAAIRQQQRSVSVPSAVQNPRQRALDRSQAIQQRQQAIQQRRPAETTGVGTPSNRDRTAIRDRTSIQAARQGRFSSRFATVNATPAIRAQRFAGIAPRDAWRRGWRAHFVPWFGPVFWPYAYSDIFDYAFWPAAYDEGYWAYAYDDLLDGVFWPSGSPSSNYASAGPTAPYGTAPQQYRSPQAVRQVCADPGNGITAWPLARIEQTVQPNPEQRALLDELKQAAALAADTFKASCTDAVALTPPARLQVMANRIDATLEAVRAVRPALEKFYDSLSDEQKARFNTLGPNVNRNAAQNPPQQDATASCAEPKPGLTNLPIERIEQVVQPAEAQKAALDRLAQATDQALQTLQAACPDVIALTPVGRLEAMEKRLTAMSQAAHQVEPALNEFYGSLSNEQKARFNSMSATASR